MLELILPSVEYEKSFRSYVEELKTFGRSATEMDSKRLLQESNDFADFVMKLRAGAEGKFLPDGYVPHTRYWLVDCDKFIGGVDIRHRLNDHLEKVGGHIGYAIRPGERSRGYGNEILKLALPKAKELGLARVLLTCDDTNIASAKIIEKNGGVFENTSVTDGGLVKRRYWITLK